MRMLTSAKGLIPLQNIMSGYANNFKLDKYTSKEQLPVTFDDSMKHIQAVAEFFSGHEQEAFERTAKQNTNGQDMTIFRAMRQLFRIVLDSLTGFSNTLTETGQDHLLNEICFESMTTLDVECFFKGMRADHDMPTVTGYPYRRARCVEDNMPRIYQGNFSYFTGPNSYYPEKIIKRDPPNITSRPNKQSCTSEGMGDKEEDIRLENTMRDFVREYGRGVRQENVRSKTKKLTGTLPYALSMRPAEITAPLEAEDDHVSAAFQIVDTNHATGGRNVRIKIIYRKEDFIAVRHNQRREISPYWLAVLLEDVEVHSDVETFIRNSVKFQWLNQTDLCYTSGDFCDRNTPKCILARVLDFTCEKSGDLLTVNVSPKEDVRLCRIPNGDVEEDEDRDEDDRNDAGVVNDQGSEQSLPRLEGVSLSGWRTTRFFLG